MRRITVVAAVLALVTAAAFAQIRNEGASPGSSSGRLDSSRAAQVHYERGQSFADRGDWERAIGELQRCVEIEEDNTDALLLLGRGFRETRDPDRAMRHYLLVVRYRPRIGEAHVAIGELALMRDNVMLALKHFFALRDLDSPRASDLGNSIERYVRART